MGQPQDFTKLLTIVPLDGTCTCQFRDAGASKILLKTCVVGLSSRWIACLQLCARVLKHLSLQDASAMEAAVAAAAFVAEEILKSELCDLEQAHSIAKLVPT
eukprot:5995650-Amphidinium_carterae.1